MALRASRDARTMLFVPATRLERVAKAQASGADLVIIDLEDAVAEADKAEARRALADFLEQATTPLFVRMNGASTDHFEADIALCSQADAVHGIMLPKTESAGDVQRARIDGKALWPLVESVRGVINIPHIAVCDGIERLTFGALDLSLDLGAEAGSEGAVTILDQCRAQLILHSRLNGLAGPVESVEPDFRNTEKVAAVALRAAQMGFTGMLCIHPGQIEPVRRAFSPTSEQLEWARRVVDGVAEHGATFQLDGQMVDEPVIQRARRLIAAAG